MTYDLLQDLKIALSIWQFLEKDIIGDDATWADPEMKRIMDKYFFSEKEVMNSLPEDWQIVG